MSPLNADGGVKTHSSLADRPNSLAYWFPRLSDAGVPVPRTEIVTIDSEDVRTALFAVFDGEPIGAAGREWLDAFRARAIAFGLPCFLRTGETSDKHDWRNTCHLTDPDKFDGHILRLIEFSECAGIFGLDWSVWALRELLPVRPAFKAFHGGMPIVQEFRCFAQDGEVVCIHPYWPHETIQEADCEDWQERLSATHALTERQRGEVLDLVRAASRACSGAAWSIDVLATDTGWHVTDMALASMSFHWPGCSNGQR
jgi:hypothetical protein